jgi:hypothetical protein
VQRKALVCILLGGEGIDCPLELVASLKSAQGPVPRVTIKSAKKIALGRAMNGSN